MPDEHANLEDLLRALTETIVCHNQRYSTGRFDGVKELIRALERGRRAWDLHAFRDARRDFVRAGSLIVNMLSRGDVPSSIILQNLMSGSWPGYHDLLDSFARFTTRCLQASLPSTRPLAIVVQKLQFVPANAHRDAVIWDCVFDAYSLTEYNQDEFSMIASMRAKMCRELSDKSRLSTCAANAVARLQAKDLGSDSVEMDEKFWLAKIQTSEQSYADAIRSYKQIIAIARERDKWWDSCFEIEAHQQIGYLYGYCQGKPRRALKRFEDAICKSWSMWGPCENKTAEALRLALFFCDDCNLVDEKLQLKDRHAKIYDHLETLTDGLWQRAKPDISFHASDNDHSSNLWQAHLRL